ncbi:MAG: ribbon-helix-helix domain-containing protein [Candidatus Thorarchaeota archaeon]
MSGKPRKKRPRKDDVKNIISVTISEKIKIRLDELVVDRVARSRAQLIEDAVRWYLDFTVNKWNERGIYVNDMRVLLHTESLSSLFFSQLTPADQYELGKTSGKQAPIADVIKLFHGKDPQDESTRDLVLEMLQIAGWGSFKIRDRSLIVIGSPFYPPSYLKGFLESLLGVKLDLMETNVKETVALKIL